MELSARISAGKLAAKVGSRMRVLVNSVGPDGAIARGPGDAPEIDGVVKIARPGKCAAGEFLEVTITGSDAYDLTARPA